MAAAGSTQEEIDEWHGNFLLENSAYFTVPHIDLHFLMKPMDFYDTITCASFPPCVDENGENIIEFFTYPEAEYLPEGFWADPTSAVPGQGIHWSSDETMTREEFLTYPAKIFGTYDGRVMFLEPMYSLDNLRYVKENGPQVADYPPGARIATFEETDIYVPTQIRASYADGYYTVEFTSNRYYTRAEPEPTSDPEEPTCGCSSEDFVARDEFETLADTVRELQRTLGAVEADSNDVMTGLGDMASCMADVASRFEREESTYEPMPETTMKEETEEPETTMYDDSEEEETTMKEEETTMKEEETTTMEEVKTTMMETQIPAEEPDPMYELVPVEGDNNSCSANQRAFTMDGLTLEECAAATMNAEEYVNVPYLSISDSTCYGCMKLNRAKNGFMAYELVRNARRQLSELEMLRAENAALKKELARRM